MTDINQIAKGLSDAQRRAMLGMAPNAIFQPCYSGFRWDTWAVLKSKGLIRSVSGAYGKAAEHCFTKKGRALRTHLKGLPND